MGTNPFDRRDDPSGILHSWEHESSKTPDGIEHTYEPPGADAPKLKVTRHMDDRVGVSVIRMETLTSKAIVGNRGPPKTAMNGLRLFLHEHPEPADFDIETFDPTDLPSEKAGNITN